MSPYELVVARYRENLGWLRRVPSKFKITIYNKGDASEYRIPDARCEISLPNTGREAHTYLHHIVDRYEDLAPVTVFCQGRPFDHVPNFHTLLKQLARGELEIDGFRWLGFVIDRDDRNGTRLFQQWSKNAERRPLPMDRYWKELFGSTIPKEFVFYLGAHFIVTADQIRQRPHSFYQRALRLADKVPDAAHCFERTWDQTFGVNGIPEVFRETNYPVYFRPVQRLGTTWSDVAQHPSIT